MFSTPEATPYSDPNEHVEPYIAPSLFSSEESPVCCDDIATEASVPEDSPSGSSVASEETPNYVIPYSEVLNRKYGSEATMPEGSPSAPPSTFRKIIVNICIVLAFIANIIFFLPLCLLGLFGLSKHPFLGYFMFRDMLRR